MYLDGVGFKADLAKGHVKIPNSGAVDAYFRNNLVPILLKIFAPLG